MEKKAKRKQTEQNPENFSEYVPINGTIHQRTILKFSKIRKARNLNVNYENLI